MYIQLMSRETARVIAEQCLGLRTRWAHRVVGRIFDDALRPFGIGGAQLNLLVGIALAGPVRPGDLAAWFSMDKSTMSRNVQRMTERGWVRIEVDEDARSQRLSLTRAGDRLLERLRPAWEQAQAEAAEALGDAMIDGLHALPLHLPQT